MSNQRHSTALAIKRCLDHLAADARRGDMKELVELIGLASLAAADAAEAFKPTFADLRERPPQGHC